MGFKNIRPLHVKWQEGVELNQLSGVFYGIKQILQIAGVSKEIKQKLCGIRDLDLHIGLAQTQSKIPGYLNGVALLDSLAEDPTYKTDTKYDLLVVREPMHWSVDSLRTISGVGRQKQGAIITVASYLHHLKPVPGESDSEKSSRKWRYWLATQMLTMHELGHVFGLFPGTTKKDPTDQELEKAHCLNDCAMYWQENRAMEIRIITDPFCPECLEKLKQFFL